MIGLDAWHAAAVWCVDWLILPARCDFLMHVEYYEHAICWSGMVSCDIISCYELGYNCQLMFQYAYMQLPTYLAYLVKPLCPACV